MSADITIDDSDYQLKIGLVNSVLPEIPGLIIEESSGILESHLVDEIPKKTGRLAGSVVREIIGNMARIFTTAGYGKFVDEDTRPHIIRPVNGPFLVFEIDGVTVFAKEVRHPGTKGQHFRARAIKAATQPILDSISRILGETFSDIQGK